MSVPPNAAGDKIHDAVSDVIDALGHPSKGYSWMENTFIFGMWATAILVCGALSVSLIAASIAMINAVT